jgi:hypothetical protein
MKILLDIDHWHLPISEAKTSTQIIKFRYGLLAPRPNISFEADGFAAAQFQR